MLENPVLSFTPDIPFALHFIVPSHLVHKGKTTIIISHRTSSVKNADQIIVLDEGRVVQSGTHAELIRVEGYYQDIYNQQLEEKLSGQET